MLYYGHSTQTQLKSQTTKLDNVHMLFVTGHEKYKINVIGHQIKALANLELLS